MTAAIQFLDEQILFVDGQIAFDPACCCGGGADPCTDFNAGTTPAYYKLTISGVVGTCGFGDCNPWNATRVAERNIGEYGLCYWEWRDALADQCDPAGFYVMSSEGTPPRGPYVAMFVANSPSMGGPIYLRGSHTVPYDGMVDEDLTVEDDNGFVCNITGATFHLEGTNTL